MFVLLFFLLCLVSPLRHVVCCIVYLCMLLRCVFLLNDFIVCYCILLCVGIVVDSSFVFERLCSLCFVLLCAVLLLCVVVLCCCVCVFCLRGVDCVLCWLCLYCVVVLCGVDGVVCVLF